MKSDQPSQSAQAESRSHSRPPRDARYPFHVVVLFTFALALPSPAKASILGEENAQLAAIFGNQLKELKEFQQMVAWLKASTSSINETLALARRAAEIYREIQEYSPMDLLMDARKGFYKAVPDLKVIEGEIIQGVKNGIAIRRGPDAFFSHRDFHEPWAKDMGDSLFGLGYRGVARKILSEDDPKDPSVVDRLIHQHYRDAGEAVRLAGRKTGLGFLQEKVDALVEDSEAKERVDFKMSGVGLELSLETASNTGDLVDAKRVEIAQEEAWRRGEAIFNRQLGRDLADEAESLFRPAWME